jgi:glycosyltransferase involved in cell wall biosynthesis
MNPTGKGKNEDRETVDSFGDEWTRFDQSALSDEERNKIFSEYFAIFPWDELPPDAEGFDLGCGSGRWAMAVAAKVGRLHCIDASPAAISVAKKNLAGVSNVSFNVSSVDDIPLAPGSQDFGYSLGVLHHVPDTVEALACCVKTLKRGAPFLLYLYYAFENRPRLYALIWKISDVFRRVICSFPPPLKSLSTEIAAFALYLPLARGSLLLERLGFDVRQIPLSYYRNHSLYTMRTDARDRFGTPIEKRFTRQQVAEMMESAGLTDVRFSESQPFWCAVGKRAPLAVREGASPRASHETRPYPRPPVRVLGLALYSNLAASTRHRLSQYIAPLGERGIELTVHSLLDDEYLRRRYGGQRLPYASMASSMLGRARDLSKQHSFDCAILYCELFPLMPSWMELPFLELPYIYDLDDAFYMKYRSGNLGKLSFLLGDKIDHLIRSAASVSAGNSTLLSYAKRLNEHASFFPTVVDTRRYGRSNSSTPRGPFNIGWIGSPSTAPYLNLIVKPLEKLARESPIRLTVIGGDAPLMRGVEIVSLDWSESTEVELISQFDVGVMPLHDDPWSRGKCAFKLIQYMACGLPVVASPVGANIEVVTPECGRLAPTADAWCQELRYFRDNRDAGRIMGEAGRMRVEAHYSLASQAPRMAKLIEDVVARAHGKRPSPDFQ